MTLYTAPYIRKSLSSSLLSPLSKWLALLGEGMCLRGKRGLWTGRCDKCVTVPRGKTIDGEGPCAFHLEKERKKRNPLDQTQPNILAAGLRPMYQVYQSSLPEGGCLTHTCLANHREYILTSLGGSFNKRVIDVKPAEMGQNPELQLNDCARAGTSQVKH